MSEETIFRKSQGIVPFGVGSIITFSTCSLMMAGLEAWPQVSPNTSDAQKTELRKATRIIDGRLQKRLSAALGRRINYFLSIPEGPELRSNSFIAPDVTTAFMPFVRFPTWYFCPRCRTMWEIPWNTPPGDDRLRCHSMVDRATGMKCGALPKNKRPYLIPVRFAVACKAGHITDFPWQEWAHRGKENCGARSGKLLLLSTGGTGLSGIEVRCSECGARNTLAGAFHPGAFSKIWPGGCPGERPWLGPQGREEDCHEDLVTVQCGAANAYFPNTVSSILIPPYSQILRGIIDKPDLWEQILATISNSQPNYPLLKVLAKQNGIAEDVFIQAVEEKLGQENTSTSPVSEQDYRMAEYNAFRGSRPPREERVDFDIIHQPIEEYDPSFAQFFEHVIMIPRLRETRALLGFSRVEPVEPMGEQASLSLQPQKWFPANAVRGEGIFLVLRADAIHDWIKLHPPVEGRTAILNKQLEKTSKTGRQITTSFLLLHSLAHVLIRQMVFDCGYDASALRERIYAGDTDQGSMTGLLIYTASGDSEGTLGGLVRQGLPGRLEKTFLTALENAYCCSSDPLCSESMGQGVNSLNLAACHACLLLPETSCEEGNRLLDRAMLIGTTSKPNLGFFSELHR